MLDATEVSILVADENYPSNKLVEVHAPTGNITSSSVYRFDFTNMNEESRRYYTTRELAPGNEYSLMSRLYDGFETGALLNIGKAYNANDGLKKTLESGGTFATGTDVGYRTPNIREGVVMYLYCNSTWLNTTTMVGSYYSFGDFGNGYDEGFYTWEIRKNRVTLNYKTTTTSIRLIKDWNP